MTAWSISVKTVGGARTTNAARQKEHTAASSNSLKNSDVFDGPTTDTVNCVNKEVPSNFTVSVNAQDSTSMLHERIEAVTGLKAAQQRLIYRGRLMTDSDVLSEVPGLCDGQTIHLVPRPLDSSNDNNSSDATSSSSIINNESSGDSGSNSSVSASATSLLATLLGLGVSGAFSSSDNDDGNDDDDDTGNNNNTAEDASNAVPTHRRNFRNNTSLLSNMREQRRQIRSISSTRRHSRNSGNSSNNNNIDRTSLEPVRQGLLTMHTMLQDTSRASDSMDSSYPRRWYRGQWLDVKDTVDQWLEATVVEVVYPQDVFTPEQILQNNPPTVTDDNSSVTIAPVDPIVGADDLDGRRELFLQPNTSFLRDPPDSPNQVQLLLVHYNGWPHRWDEWIRSDSDRIRCFRTKTRHSPAAPYASPAPNSIYSAAPNTYIHQDDQNDRSALLPELQRVFSAVHDLLSQAIPSNNTNDTTIINGNDITNNSPSHLPWQTTAPPTTTNDGVDNHIPSITSITPSQQQQLRTLAPLLDRLGRVLTDAAPHVATFANSSTTPNGSNNNELEGFSHSLVNLSWEENPTRRARSTNPVTTMLEGMTGDEERVPSLARLLRVGDNGGIDIHIHAIVTPMDAVLGGPTGVFPFPMTGLQPITGAEGGDVNSNSNTNINNERAPTLWQEDEEAMGLFSELYTETPPPFTFAERDSDDVVPAETEEQATPEDQEDSVVNYDDMPPLIGYSVGVGDIPSQEELDNSSDSEVPKNRTKEEQEEDKEDSDCSPPPTVTSTSSMARAPNVFSQENASVSVETSPSSIDSSNSASTTRDRSQRRGSTLGRIFRRTLGRSYSADRSR